MATKFTFLLLPQIHLLDLAGPDQAIHEAMDYGADFEIEYCSIENNIVSTAGLPLGKVKSYKSTKLKKGDYLVIPGSNFAYLNSPEFRKQKEFLNWIVKQHANGVSLCSICAGAFVLAESGLLDGINCTRHFKKTKELQQLFPLAKVQENI